MVSLNRLKWRLMQRRSNHGFTLIEAIIVIVILGLLSAVGSQFIVTAMNSYSKVEVRSALVQRGRLAIEQITREIHMSLPNAIRVSDSGLCMEFMPIVGSTKYHKTLPDVSNSVTPVSSINTSSFTLGMGEAKHVVVGAFTPIEVYQSASTSARVDIGVLGSPPYSVIPLDSSGHTFFRNSINQRVFITDDPVRYCVNGGNLLRYSGYGLLTTPLDDSVPSGIDDLVSHEVAAIAGDEAFELSPGSQDINMALYIKLAFSKGMETVDLNHQVLVRNVP